MLKILKEERNKMPETDYDFSGYATKNDLPCADGRVIRRDAFRGNDGMVVPLVWMHQHNSVGNVLGHALLENREQPPPDRERTGYRH